MLRWTWLVVRRHVDAKSGHLGDHQLSRFMVLWPRAQHIENFSYKLNGWFKAKPRFLREKLLRRETGLDVKLQAKTFQRTVVSPIAFPENRHQKKRTKTPLKPVVLPQIPFSPCWGGSFRFLNLIKPVMCVLPEVEAPDRFLDET